MMKSIDLRNGGISLELVANDNIPQAKADISSVDLNAIPKDTALTARLRALFSVADLPVDVYMQKSQSGPELIIKHKGLPPPTADEWPSAQRGKP